MIEVAIIKNHPLIRQDLRNPTETIIDTGGLFLLFIEKRFISVWYFAKHDVRCAIAACVLRCAVASCDVRVRTHFVETCDVRAVHFQACDVRLQLRKFFSNNVSYED